MWWGGCLGEVGEGVWDGGEGVDGLERGGMQRGGETGGI